MSWWCGWISSARFTSGASSRGGAPAAGFTIVVGRRVLLYVCEKGAGLTLVFVAKEYWGKTRPVTCRMCSVPGTQWTNRQKRWRRTKSCKSARVLEKTPESG
jgi:hypothetical protein